MKLRNQHSRMPQPGDAVRSRRRALVELESWLELPLQILGLIWLVLLVWELVRGLNPVLEFLGGLIWAIFLVDFGLRFALAPRKRGFLRHNWLAALSLLLPAFRALRATRTLRLLRISRAARPLRLVRIVTSLNRTMRGLAQTMGRRKFGYVASLTCIVTFAGAAGMFAFEDQRFATYGDALWWTAMLMTTLGSEVWPQSAEGRVLCFLLALYAFAVFGYVTAALASFFVGRDAEENNNDALQMEIAALRRELRALRR